MCSFGLGVVSLQRVTGILVGICNMENNQGSQIGGKQKDKHQKMHLFFFAVMGYLFMNPLLTSLKCDSGLFNNICVQTLQLRRVLL